MSGQFPVTGFQKLARLLDEENEVFQRHVLDLARDLVDDAEMHSGFMETLRERLPATAIDAFLKAMPCEKGHYVRPGPVQDLLTLVEGLKDSHASQNDIATMIASELIHRRKWEQVMEEYPDTLQALKNRME